MQLPEGAYTAKLTDYQFRLLSVLCHLSGSEGRLKASISELCKASGGVGEKTVRRALIALEQAGYISKSRTRRANGKLSTLQVVIRSPQDSVGIIKAQNDWDSNDRTSHDYKSSSQPTIRLLVPNSQDSNKLKDSESKGIHMKEIVISMRKWQDDGDDLAGYGLVEPKDVSGPKIRKSDPKTRGRRPQHEWTPMDVAAEFSFLVGRKYPLLPGTVNVKQLSGALAKFRKQYQTTALLELELLRLFMADERNFKNIGDEAPLLYKRFLHSFAIKINQARENLGLSKITVPENPVVKIGSLVASDGRVFQNSLSGRAQLERYEKRLKENKS